MSFDASVASQSVPADGKIVNLPGCQEQHLVVIMRAFVRQLEMLRTLFPNTSFNFSVEGTGIEAITCRVVYDRLRRGEL